MSVVSIRGAITVEENTRKAILDGTLELLEKIEEENHLQKDRVVSIIFSATSDLDKAYPAKAARDKGYVDCGLMCFNEMAVEDSLRKCIRVLILYNSDVGQSNVRHVYLRDAKGLRPDLVT
jgi:chorismate mutase